MNQNSQTEGFPPIPDAPAGPIAPEGIPIVGLFMTIGAATTVGALMLLPQWPWAGYIVGALALILNLWCLWFFRDPARVIPGDPSLVVSPADGEVVAVDQTPPPPEVEVSEEFRKGCRRISIFMNVFSVHVNRAPVAGTVTSVKHTVGKFLNAAWAKASIENERCSLVMKMEDGSQVAAIQIAGLVARRIICRVPAGTSLNKGERYGLIRFGSRVDVFVPESAIAEVKLGQKVTSGRSVIARMPSR